jgi:hypothetical protein
MTSMRLITGLVAGSAMAAAATAVIDLLDGADLRWAVAANLLLVPPAAILAAGALRTAAAPVAALCGLGVPAALVGALLGDRAGGTWWWLALETAWWTGVALAAWPVRPGLAVISALAAVLALAAAAITGLRVAEPVASGAGLRVMMTIAWAAWVGVDLAVRATAGSPAPVKRP